MVPHQRRIKYWGYLVSKFGNVFSLTRLESEGVLRLRTGKQISPNEIPFLHSGSTFFFLHDIDGHLFAQKPYLYKLAS